MMAGIAAHIVVGRLPTALDLEIGGLEIEPASPGETLGAVWRGIGGASLDTLALTALATGICLVGRVRNPRFPAALAALVVAAALAHWLDPDGAVIARSTGSAVGWGLSMPRLEPAAILDMLPAALVVAFLCLFQTTVVLRGGSDGSAADRRNAIGAVGLANLAAAGVGGFAVNASPLRTQILRDAGATSRKRCCPGS